VARIDFMLLCFAEDKAALCLACDVELVSDRLLTKPLVAAHNAVFTVIVSDRLRLVKAIRALPQCLPKASLHDAPDLLFKAW
jgi:hypothetical protein